MTGKGYDRWFDKSFTLCIGSNGRVRIMIFMILFIYIYNEILFILLRWVLMQSIHGEFNSIIIRLLIQQFLKFKCTLNI